MKKGIIVSVTLALTCLSLAARTSELKREFVSPVRIVWTQGDVQQADCLLSGNLGQGLFGKSDCCLMKTTSGQMASVVVDFGKEFQGGIQLVSGQYSGSTPIKIRVRLGESVTEAMSEINEETGATNDHAIRDFVTELPWLGFREFGNSGFRFARIDVLDADHELALREVNGIKEYRDIEYATFRSSDKRLDEIWKTGAYTVHQNMQQYIWDGIKRDRLVWIGDMHPEVMCVNSVFGDQDVVERSLDLARDCAPLPKMMNGMSAYSLWWIIIHRDWFLYQGDRDYLVSQRDYMRGLIDVLIGKIGEDGRDTIKDHFLDWPSKADEKASAAGFHALFIMAMEAAGQICEEIGESEYAGKCAKARETLVNAAPSVVSEFFAEDKPFTDPGRKQAVSLMCLADMIPAQKAAPALLEGGALGFSTFYGYYMLEALAKCGEYQKGMDIASAFWGGMLDLGATTFWEDFDIRWLENAARIDEITPEGKVDVHLTYGGYCYKQLRHSLAHGWASGPTSWMTKHILGLYPVENACRTVALEPHLGNLEWIDGSLPTPYGEVKVKLQNNGDRVFAIVDAPKQVKVVPASNVTAVYSDIDMDKPSVAALESGFKNVPDSVKTAVYWYWLQNNISKEGVIKDLQAMKKAGINRAFIGNQGNDALPEGAVKFGSEQWWEVTHTALKTATELGIEIGIFNCPGWSQSGGPWIKEEQSMRYVETEFTDFAADGSNSLEISVPESVISVIAFEKIKGKTSKWEFSTEKGKPFSATLEAPFTVRSLSITPSAVVNCKARLKFDGKTITEFDFDRRKASLNVGFKPFAPVTVALPECKEGKFILEIDAPAKDKITVELSENPTVEDYAGKSLAKMFQEPLPMWDHYMWVAKGECRDASLIIDPAKVQDLSSMAVDGKISWKAPKGEWTVMTAYMKTTGVENSPAVAEATGLEVDKMSRKHVNYHFDAFLGEIIRRIPPQDRACWKVVVEDSYETGGLNWTDDMKPVFEDTYGYDPTPYLPTLAGMVVGSAEKSERFLWDLRRLIADRVAYDYVGGLRDKSHQFGLETWLECYGHWGFPGEFLQYGGQSDQVAGEYWSEGTLGDIENRAASSCGHIYGKQKIWAESCTAAGSPYLRYPEIMKQRVDRFFCEGINASLLHLMIQQSDDREPGLNAWYGNEFNRKNTWFGAMDVFTSYLKRCNFLLQQGQYVADVAYFIGEDAPKMTGECTPALPKGYSFDYINAEVLKKARVEDGKLVLGSGMQYKVLVLPNQKTMRPEMLECIESLVNDGLVILGPAPETSPSLSDWGKADEKIRSIAAKLWKGQCGKGKVYPEGTSLETVFSDLGIAPDFSYASEGNIAFIHRSLDSGEQLYFVANQDEKKALFNASFRVPVGLKAELWNPVTGETSAVETKNGTISLALDSLESVFVVFRHNAAQVNSRTLDKTIAVSKSWTVNFAESCGNEAFTVTFPQLQDWSLSSDERVRYYSGNATYSNVFNLASKQVKAGKITLSLGKVMVMAKVYVNGQYAGGAWTAPYSLDITPFVKSGSNKIEVVVYNNWNNRLVADSKIPAAERKTWTPVGTWKPDSPLQSSGLLGPVTVSIFK